MKRTTFYILFFQLFVLFTACKKEIMSYEGKEGVYFAMRHGTNEYLPNLWPYQPFTDIDFVRMSTDEIDFPVQVMITGPSKSYDRIYRVEVNPDSTNAILGQHYEALKDQYILPAGAVSAQVNVRLKRTADLEEKPVTLGLKLVATKDFALSFPEWHSIPSLNSGTVVPQFDATLHSLHINDVMVQPAVWSGSLQAGNRESGLFGVFSRRKMEFLAEYLGLKYEDFGAAETMPMARMMLIASDATKVLVNRYNEGKPVLEDDGRLMWMGTVPWTSYLGVPWVPAG